MKLDKVTKRESRCYPDACATAHALDLMGERWALLVMRELLLGPRRFGDLKASLSGISANVLSQRLEGLEISGVVRRRRLPPPASVQVYELTAWGYEAEPVILALGRWGARSPMQDTSMPLSAVASMLSLRAMFDSRRAGDATIRLSIRIGEDVFALRLADGILDIRRGSEAAPDLALAGSPEAIVGLVYGFAPLERLERDGVLTLEGDRSLLARFADMFELPPKAEGGAGAGFAGRSRR